MTLDAYVSLVERARDWNLLRIGNPKIIEQIRDQRRDEEMAAALTMDLAMRIKPPVD